jgi:hypothetical protein
MSCIRRNFSNGANYARDLMNHLVTKLAKNSFPLNSNETFNTTTFKSTKDNNLIINSNKFDRTKFGSHL